MINLTQFTNNGIDLVIDTQIGEVYYPSYQSLARVCSFGLSGKIITATQVKRTVVSELKGVTLLSLVQAEILTPGGLQGVTLIPRKLGSKVIRKYNPDLWEEMAEAGHLVFLHQLIGYQVSSRPRRELPHLLTTAQQWEKLYEPEFCKKVFSWMGASFYWIFLYQFLTEAEVQHLNEVNPVVNGDRKERVHQYLQPETRERLVKEVVKLEVLVGSSTSRQDFLTRYNRLFGFHQLELPSA